MRRSVLVLALALLCALPAGASSELPAMRARFALRRANLPVEHLELVRSGDKVAHRFVERGYRELWQRDARGDLEHVRAYPAEGKSVHYTPGDLRTIHVWPSWDSLAQLLGESELQALMPAGNKLGFERLPVRVLKGNLRGQPARLEWLDALALPSRLTLGAGKHQLVVELIAFERCEDGCQEQEPDLRSLEFSDLGDMEYDPFVRRFLAREHRHAHPLH